MAFTIRVPPDVAPYNIWRGGKVLPRPPKVDQATPLILERF
jgi:hypothetical protein